MNPKELVLGYDLREDPAIGEIWWPERIKQYLLRDDINKPLSTDTVVWPSLVSDLEHGEELLNWQNEKGLWESQSIITAYLEQRPYLKSKSWLVAVALALLETDTRECVGDIGQIAPTVVDAKWKFLGYDVADFYLLSGLSNCGYTSAEREALKAEWGPYLNSHHLFSDYINARNFQNMSNKRVPEHAPFCVYGLYLVGQGA